MKRSYHTPVGDPCTVCNLPAKRHWVHTPEGRQRWEPDDISLTIEPLTKRPKDPSAEARKVKNLELQERRIQLKELVQKMKEATQANEHERNALLERAVESLDNIATALNTITAVLVAENVVRAGSALKDKT